MNVADVAKVAVSDSWLESGMRKVIVRAWQLYGCWSYGSQLLQLTELTVDRKKGEKCNGVSSIHM